MYLDRYDEHRMFHIRTDVFQKKKKEAILFIELKVLRGVER